MMPKNSKMQKTAEIFGIFLILFLIVFIIVQWKHIPGQIPAHYGALGEIDKWGNRNSILWLPVTAVILYFPLSAVYLHPVISDSRIKVTAENVYLYQTVKNMMIFLKLELAAAFFFITYRSAAARALPIAFLPIFLLVVFGTAAYFLVRIFKASVNTRTEEKRGN